jgi:hypothetical protein
VWVLEVPAPAQPLAPSATALGPFYNVGAVTTTKAPVSLPFAIAFPVPEGADTAHLAMAMLVPAEEGMDSTETGPAWEPVRGLYDDQNDLFTVALPALVIEGRTVVLMQHPEMTPIAPDEIADGETAARAAHADVPVDDIEFYVACDDSIDPGACQPDVTQQFKDGLLAAYNKFTGLGYELPALQRAAARIRHRETSAGEVEIVNIIRYDGAYIMAEPSGFLTGVYKYNLMKIRFSYDRSEPNPDIPRATTHELFHAFQMGGTPPGSPPTPAYLDWDHHPQFVETSWIVEGTAIAAEDSADTMKRSAHAESAVGLHPVNRSLLASDMAERGADENEIVAYQAQDFWVYFANKRADNPSLGYLKPLFARGAGLKAAVDFFAQDLGTSLGAEYWAWVKNQAIEKTVTLGGALTDPGRIEIPRDNPVIGEDIAVIDYPAGEIHSVTAALPILTAAVVQINIKRDVAATTVTVDPLYGGPAYRVYLNGECASEGGPCYARIPEGMRTFDNLATGDVLYAIIANTNTDRTKRIKYTLTVRPVPPPPPPP